MYFCRLEDVEAAGGRPGARPEITHRTDALRVDKGGSLSPLYGRRRNDGRPSAIASAATRTPDAGRSRCRHDLAGKAGTAVIRHRALATQIRPKSSPAAC